MSSRTCIANSYRFTWDIPKGANESEIYHLWRWGSMPL